MSTATTLSSDPAPWGLARLMNDAITIMMATAMTAGMTILAGGRFFFAVPYSSPMLIVGPAATAGGAGGIGGGGTGVSSGIGLCRAFGSIRDDSTLARVPDATGMSIWAQRWLESLPRLPNLDRRSARPLPGPREGE